MIRIEGLNKYYHKGKSNELHVINNTTVTLPDSGLVCILGESGSGKTTFMNVIGGLDDFDEGLIEADGIQINKSGRRDRIRNEKFAYIFQNYYLLMDRTAEYNIKMALSMHELSEEEKEERTDYVLKAVNMLKYKKKLVSQLSGGQQQRIGIARALVKSPKVIFADEPTGNLDEANTIKIMKILKKISKNCLVLLVTHEQTIADFFADKIIKITDGCMEKGTAGEGKTVYQYMDDSNLYLGEYPVKKLRKRNVELEIYGETQDTMIQLVYDNERLYVSAGEARNIEFLTDESEQKVIDSKRPVIEAEEADDSDFELKPVPTAEKSKLKFRELVDIAVRNRRAMGIKQIFLAVTLFTMSVLMVISMQEILSAVLIDREAVVDKDSRYYKVTAQTERDYDEPKTHDFRVKFGVMTQALTEADFELYAIPDTVLEYQYRGIGQLENYSFEIKDYSFMVLDKMKQNLLYGRMPKVSTEVVLDRLVVERFFEDSGELSHLITDVRQVLGKTITTKQGIDLTIAGISDTGEPDIYISYELLLMLCRENFIFITEEEVQKKFSEYQSRELGITPDGKVEVLVSKARLQTAYIQYLSDSYGELSVIRYKLRYEAFSEEETEALQKLLAKLEELFGITAEEYDQMLLSDAYLDYKYDGLLTGDIRYQVVGYYDVEEEADYIIPEKAVPYMEKAIMDYYRSCYVYADAEDADEMVQKIREAIPEEKIKSLQLTIVNEAEEEFLNYKTQKMERLQGRILLIAVICVISMTILYFIMRAAAAEKIQDLNVYRMMGIPKRSIVRIFAWENFMITSYTSLPSVFLTIFAGFMLERVQSLGISFTYPWYAVILTVIFFYAANILVGILPVCGLLKLPPAQLAAKYDI